MKKYGDKMSEKKIAIELTLKQIEFIMSLVTSKIEWGGDIHEMENCIELFNNLREIIHEEYDLNW